MNSQREHELMTRARILALLQQEKNLLRKLPNLEGRELHDIEARLAAGRCEHEHLNALLRHDPRAVAAEEARLRQVDIDFERAVVARNQEALAVPRDELPLAEAQIAVGEDIAALDAIQADAIRFAALAAMGSRAEEQSAYREALEQQAPNVAGAVTIAHAAVTYAWEAMQAERGAAIQRAEIAVADFISSERTAEYSYTETFNPEGRPAAYFHEQARLARSDMMEALATLADDDAEALLTRRPRLDHDGSTFAAASLQEVRAYRAVLTGRDYPAHAIPDSDRLAAEEAIRSRTVSNAVMALHNALSWGDEEQFHGAFEAVKQHPAIDAIAVAKAITGREHETRDAALGAIESKFYALQLTQEQAVARGAR